MPLTPFQFPLTGGLDRSTNPTKADPATFYTLANMRQGRSQRGLLEQTPRFTVTATVSGGTYWNGSASTTEPATSTIRWAQQALGNQTIVIKAYTFGVFGGSYLQKKCVYQTAQPATDGVTKGCLFTFVDAVGASVSLGQTYDIVIDAATTFKWRVNGGAYTTGVAIDAVNGNLIDSNTVRLYWLASTGFTVADTWSFKRTDRVFNLDFNPFTSTIPEVLVSANNLYLSTPTDARLVVITTDSNGVPYLRSVGYRAVYGTNPWVSDNHLFATMRTAGFSEYIQSSDRDNFDNFTATDLNEADTYHLQKYCTQALDTNGAVTLSGFVLQGRTFVLTTNGVFYSDYVGLPIVYDFKFAFDFRFNYSAAVGNIHVCGTNVIYYYDGRGLYVFDGSVPRMLIRFSSAGVVLGTTLVKLCYNPVYNEVYLNCNNGTTLLVYQADYNTWYTRSVDFSASGNTALSVDTTGAVNCGSASGVWYIDAVDASVFSGTPVMDSAAGTAFAVPTITTQLLGNVCTQVKEAAPLYLAASVQSSGGSNYSIGSNIKVIISWYVADTGLITGSPITNTAAFWTNLITDGKVNFPRVSYRYLAFELTVVGTDGTKPAGAFSLQGLETEVYNMPNVKR